tara:strand:- start:2507 stop:2989 length:483 start_codon:yes stop_codon:yes gene_type:complete
MFDRPTEWLLVKVSGAVLSLSGFVWLLIINWRIAGACLLLTGGVGGCALLFGRSAGIRLRHIREMLGSVPYQLPGRSVARRVWNLERESGILPPDPLDGDMPPRETLTDRIEAIERILKKDLESEVRRRERLTEELEALEESFERIKEAHGNTGSNTRSN